MWGKKPLQFMESFCIFRKIQRQGLEVECSIIIYSNLLVGVDRALGP